MIWNNLEAGFWVHCLQNLYFDLVIANTDTLKNFKIKVNLCGNIEIEGANRILRHETISVPLKHLSNFWRSNKMPSINCKIELELKWTKCCVLSGAGNDKNIN